MRNRKQPRCSRKQNGPRKRTGCKTCKDAHVKCTEEKPECSRCTRLSLSCQYEFKLLWEEDAQQRNIVHGRTGVWSRNGKKSIPIPGSLRSEDQEIDFELGYDCEGSEWHFVSFVPQDFVHGVPLSLLEERPQDSVFINEFEAADGFIGITTDDDENRGLVLTHKQMLKDVTDALELEVYNEEQEDTGVTELDIIDWVNTQEDMEIHSPMLSFLHNIPLIAFSDVDSQLFSYYVHELSPKCSLSTHHNPYLNVLLPVACNFEPLQHTLLAAAACQLFHYSGNRQFELHSLRHRSKAIRGLNEHLGKEKMDWKSLATMVMFCFRDITDGCEPSWITHLKMGLRMLKDIRATTRVDADLRNFCEIYFVAHDVMGRAAWEHDVSEMQHYEWDRSDCYQEIDSIMGCSRELISLISEVSHLAGVFRTKSLPSEHIVDMASNLMTRLSTLNQIQRRGVEDVNTMIQIAEVKRLAAILYLHDSIIAQVSHSSRLPTSSSLHDTIIAALQKLPATNGSSLWPLFVLGNSSLRKSEDVSFVLDRLHQLEQSRYLGSVYHARRRIERNIMKRLTMGEREMLQARWETEMPLSDNERWVSLA